MGDDGQTAWAETPWALVVGGRLPPGRHAHRADGCWAGTGGDMSRPLPLLLLLRLLLLLLLLLLLSFPPWLL